VGLFLKLHLLPTVFNLFTQQQDSFPGDRYTKYTLTMRVKMVLSLAGN